MGPGDSLCPQQSIFGWGQTAKLNKPDTEIVALCRSILLRSAYWSSPAPPPVTMRRDQNLLPLGLAQNPHLLPTPRAFASIYPGLRPQDELAYDSLERQRLTHL